jgi:hypothetical protein
VGFSKYGSTKLHDTPFALRPLASFGGYTELRRILLERRGDASTSTQDGLTFSSAQPRHYQSILTNHLAPFQTYSMNEAVWPPPQPSPSRFANQLPSLPQTPFLRY